MIAIFPDYLEAFGTPWGAASTPQLTSFAEDTITLPAAYDRSAWKVRWQVAHGALVSPGDFIVGGQLDGTRSWCYHSPVPALVDILPLPAARLPGRTQIGALRYGEGLEALLERLRRQQDAKLRRLQEESAAARHRRKQAATSLGALRRELADLTAEDARLTQEIAVGRQSLARLRSAPEGPPGEIPIRLLLATLLQRLAPAPGASAVSAALHAPLLQLLAALLPGRTPGVPPADAAAACTAIARLYDRRMKTVLAAQPGLPRALAAQKATLWHQLRETHLALLRNADPADSAPLPPSVPHPQEQTA